MISPHAIIKRLDIKFVKTQSLRYDCPVIEEDKILPITDEDSFFVPTLSCTVKKLVKSVGDHKSHLLLEALDDFS